MSKSAGFIAEVSFRLQGIPCIIGVLEYFEQPPHMGSAYTCDSDWDYYGYSEVEWRVLDRRGYIAVWLENKLTEGDRKAIATVIAKYFATSN